MGGMWQGIGEALGLGIWTAANPCPMATNIAAIAFLSRRLGSIRQTVLAGLLYAFGGMLAYVALAMLLVAGVHASPLAAFLERHMHRVLGPVLILAGMLLLGLIRLPSVSLEVGPQFQARVERWGV